jgi:hypothetical protein
MTKKRAESELSHHLPSNMAFEREGIWFLNAKQTPTMRSCH